MSFEKKNHSKIGDRIFENEYIWPTKQTLEYPHNGQNVAQEMVKKTANSKEEISSDAAMEDKKLSATKELNSNVADIQKETIAVSKKNGISEKLNQLKLKLSKFEDFSFIPLAKNLVFSDGSCDAKVMFVGEAPGEQEDIMGKPFVGKSGQLLRYFFKELNWAESDYYITNVVYWRPPGNRTPIDSEIDAMREFLFDHIEIIDPEIIVTVGAVALKALGVGAGITKAQGNVYEKAIRNKVRKIFPIYHPSYALRLSSKKYDLWLSLLKLDELIDAHKR